MRPGRSVLLLSILLSFEANAQINESFSDGELANGPTWSGDLDLFAVVDEDDDLKLRSNSPGAATYWISTPNALANDCFWEVEVDLRLNTSGSNYVEIHLISEEADPVASQNGWFVRIGGTQDKIELLKKVEGTVSPVLSSPDGVVNSTTSNRLSLRVERSEDLGWTLKYDEDLAGNITTIGPIGDPVIPIGQYFAILIEQNSTASMVNKHFFDDIIVDVLPADTIPPSIVSIAVNDASTIDIQFSEALNAASAEDEASYSVSDGIGSPASVTMISSQSVQLTLADPLLSGVSYALSIAGVSDLAGNAIDTTMQLMIAQQAGPGDLVINELLYDPIGNGSDFLEIFNRSNGAIQLAGLKIMNGSGSTVQLDEDRIMVPGAHLFLTPDTSNIFQDFPNSVKENAIQIALPSFVNTSGSAVLLAANGQQLDRFDYHDDLHFDLVDDTEGFSLERVDPDRPTDDPTNWQTASDLAGRATPGFRNSQYSLAPEPQGSLTIDPAIFSPDNDGYQDQLTITYQFDADGFVGTLMIFDVEGRKVRELFASKIMGISGSISWEGLADDGRKCAIGPYIVMLEAFDLKGNVERFKKTVTLAHHLDR